MMYVADKLLPGLFEEEAAAVPTAGELQMAIAVYFVIAAVTTPIAVCVLYWIAKKNGREDFLSAVKKENRQLPAEDGSMEPLKKKEKIVTVPFVLFTVLTLGLMIFQEVIIYLAK